MGAGQQTIHIRDQPRHTATHPPKLTRHKPPHHNGGRKSGPVTTADVTSDRLLTVAARQLTKLLGRSRISLPDRLNSTLQIPQTLIEHRDQQPHPGRRIRHRQNRRHLRASLLPQQLGLAAGIHAHLTSSCHHLRAGLIRAPHRRLHTRQLTLRAGHCVRQRTPRRHRRGRIRRSQRQRRFSARKQRAPTSHQPINHQIGKLLHHRINLAAHATTVTLNRRR